MSVIVSKRKISGMQFYMTARSLRRDITKMLEQMFYDESKFCYSKGLEYYIQTRILDLLGNMMESIVNANEIYPTTAEEVMQRKLLQNKAIGYVANIENELEYLVDLYPEKIRQVIMFIDSIDHEKKLLRRWKQSNSKILKMIQGK
ncbi:hypothetical protein [Oceanispirochaeta sp.]|jgi:hypothetical protein|uniref:hypothetical protein n=1 Tax=Oceanispirochaeta sp. TaxID=2035350 RepID=UPI00262B8984|nr:hypothetical protein [Oceanispirochaeta sp.]MDA3957970.1 hypothetical protein [Oceanispirochaeta sp.]